VSAETARERVEGISFALKRIKESEMPFAANKKCWMKQQQMEVSQDNLNSALTKMTLGNT